MYPGHRTSLGVYKYWIGFFSEGKGVDKGNPLNLEIPDCIFQNFQNKYYQSYHFFLILFMLDSTSQVVSFRLGNYGWEYEYWMSEIDCSAVPHATNIHRFY